MEDKKPPSANLDVVPKDGLMEEMTWELKLENKTLSMKPKSGSSAFSR